MMKQEMLKQLNMPGYGETSDEFIEAELEMLAMGAKDIPQGSALGVGPAHSALSQECGPQVSFAMHAAIQDLARAASVSTTQNTRLSVPKLSSRFRPQR